MLSMIKSGIGGAKLKPTGGNAPKAAPRAAPKPAMTMQEELAMRGANALKKVDKSAVADKPTSKPKMGGMSMADELAARLAKRNKAT